MDNQYIRNLRIQKKSVGKRLYAAVCLMLVTSLLLTTTSFAWLTLSQAPEVTDVATTLGANGNLEIALATSDHLASLKANNMYDDDSNFEYTNGDLVHDNVLWGNLIDLTPVDYGIHLLNMRPAILNIVNGCVADVPISVAKYGVDGRLDNMNFSTENIDLDIVGFSSVYNTEKANYYAGSVEMSIDDLKAGNYNKDVLVQSILDNQDYGVRIAGLLDYSASVDQSQNSANIDLLVDGYCFAIDLLFRTNAPSANLMLQTEGVQRMESELEDEYVGSGSFIEMDNEILSAAMKVVFADTFTGKIYALAQADTEGKLWITARANASGSLVSTDSDDAALITPLIQNRVSAITAWVFVDGSQVNNSAASTKDATAMKMNLQFSTDAVLTPAYTDITTNPNYPNRPEIPTNPDVPADAVYYLRADGGDNYSIYTLANNGSINYELRFTGTLNESDNTVTLNHVSEYPKKGVIVPAVVTLTGSEAEYAVYVDPTQAPFANLGSESAAIFFVAINDEKVGIASNDLGNLFDYDSGTGFVSIDLSGLDTSTATDMRDLFKNCNRLTYLNLDGFDTSMTAKMSSMFEGCSSLTALDVSNFNTANVTDMYEMFRNCSGLTKLDLTCFDTTNVTDMDYMFCGCSSLTELNISSFDTENVTDMGGMFASCSGLTELDLSNFKPNLENVYEMFSNCSNLTELDLSGFNTANVTNMALMFANCSSLTKLNLTSFDTANVTSMRSMFSGCSGLAALDLSSFDTANIKNMSSMFSGCSGLTELDVSNFDTANVTDMETMFWSCENLTELDLSGFDTRKVTSMCGMFSECYSLRTVNISGFNTSSVKDISGMFRNCISLEAIDLSGFTTYAVTDTTGMFYNSTNLQTMVTPKTMGSVAIELPGTYMCLADGKVYTVLDKSVPAQATLKKDDPSLSVIDTGDLTDSITWTVYNNGLLRLTGTGPTLDYLSMDDIMEIPWDSYSRDIKSVEISEGITYLGRCNLVRLNYETITIPESLVAIAGGNGYGYGFNKTVYYAGSQRQWDAVTLSYVDDALINGIVTTQKENASVVQSGMVPNANIVWTLYGDGVLTLDGSGKMPDWSEGILPPWKNYKDKIVSVVVSGSIENIGAYAFKYASNLKSVKLCASVEKLGEYAFSRCGNLLAISFEQNSVLQEVEQYCFDRCINLRDVNLPTSVTTLGESAFQLCESITYLPITNVTNLGRFVFMECSSLPSIEFAEGLERIPYGALCRCFSLASVTIPSTVKVIEYDSFDCFSDYVLQIYYPLSPEEFDLIRYGGGQSTDFLEAEVNYGSVVLTSGNVNEEITWKLYDTGVLAITGSGEMPDYEDGVGYNDQDIAEWIHEDYHTVIIADGITSVGDYAFLWAENLTTVNVTPSVTYISPYAFEGCTYEIKILCHGYQSDFETLVSGSGFPSNTTYEYVY